LGTQGIISADSVTAALGQKKIGKRDRSPDPASREAQFKGGFTKETEFDAISDEQMVLNLLRSFNWRAEKSLMRDLDIRYDIDFDRAARALKSLQTKGMVTAEKRVMWVYKSSTRTSP